MEPPEKCAGVSVSVSGDTDRAQQPFTLVSAMRCPTYHKAATQWRVEAGVLRQGGTSQ